MILYGKHPTKTYQQIMKWKNTWVCLNQWKHVWHERNEFPPRLSLYTLTLYWILETTDHSLPFICPQKHGRKDHLCVISPTAWPFSSANTCADIKSNIHYWIESRTVIGTDHPQTTTEKGQNHLKNHNNNLCDWVIEKKNSQIKKIVK